MGEVRVVSLDMESTLITGAFSEQIWEKDVPRLYAELKGLPLEEARQQVFRQYDEIGDQRPEWYDVGYWFERLGLPGDWRELPKKRREMCSLYPEVPGVLKRLDERYPLVVTSNTIREFLEVQISCFEACFHRVFSAPSDFGEVKKSPQFYERICASLGVEPGELAHVGDNREHDYEAAKSTGIRAFHLDRSGKAEGPDVVHDLEEFERRLGDA